MKLRRDSWLWKWYMESTAIVHRFKQTDHELDNYYFRRELEDLEDVSTIDICQFVRTTFVWAPLVILVNLTTAGGIIAFLALAPAYFVGPIGYWYLLSFFLKLAVGAGAIVGIWYLWAKWKNYRKEKKKLKQEDESRTTIGDITKIAYRSWKERFCAIVEIVDSEKKETEE